MPATRHMFSVLLSTEVDMQDSCRIQHLTLEMSQYNTNIGFIVGNGLIVVIVTPFFILKDIGYFVATEYVMFANAVVEFVPMLI